MNELERALHALEIEWPATPDLADAVRAEITRPRRFTGWRRRLAIALATVLVAAGGTLAVSPAARSTVWRWLGLEGVEIRREKPTATPGPINGFGVPIGLDEARRAGALFPKGLPEPSAYRGPHAIALVYPATQGLKPSKVTGVALLVQTFRARVDTMILKKMSMSGSVEFLTIGGSPAYWISGEPHGFQYSTADGNGEFVPQRLADHTLLVERGGKLLRIEGPISKQRAIELAESALS
jgi:hypothetical protein